jgi:hypothetical protein
MRWRGREGSDACGARNAGAAIGGVKKARRCRSYSVTVKIIYRVEPKLSERAA